MIFILARFDRDALGWANGGTEITGNTFCLVVRDVQGMKSPETRRYYGSLVRVLKSDRLLKEMGKCDLQTFKQRHYHGGTSPVN